VYVLAYNFAEVVFTFHKFLWQELDFSATRTIPVQPDLPLCGVVGGKDVRQVATIIR
jgi:hypothetical protein